MYGEVRIESGMRSSRATSHFFIAISSFAFLASSSSSGFPDRYCYFYLTLKSKTCH